DPNIPVDSYAQYIVDDELAKHRDLMILAIHATTPKNSDPEILSSNIGRIGALGVVFELTAHTNQKARHAEAIRIRDEIARRIPTPAKLVEPYTAPGSAQPLALLHRSDLPGYDGDFDHLFADTGENKLFVAAEDHGTVEVFNLKTGEHL